MNKIRRQLFDMQTSTSMDDRGDIKVEGLAPWEFLEQFQWNEAKHPPRRPLKETVDTIIDTVQKLEDDLKVASTRGLSLADVVEQDDCLFRYLSACCCGINK